MMVPASGKKRKMTLPLIAAGIVLFAASALAAHYIFYATIGGGLFSGAEVRPVDSSSIDLSGSSISSLKGIERCTELTELSVSGSDVTDFSALYGTSSLKKLNALGGCLSPEQYTALREALPGCEITWDIMFNGRLVRCDKVKQLDFTGIDPSEYDKIKYFPNLTIANIQNVTMTPELTELMDSLPNCRFDWNVELFGRYIAGDETFLDFNDVQVDMNELAAALKQLPYVRRVELCGSGLSNEQMEQLMEMFPKIKFVWLIKVGNWVLRTDITNFSTGHRGFSMSYIHTEDGQQLKYCTDLVALDVGHNKIHDMSFVSSLTKLRSLIYVDAGLTDISPIANCKNIEYLELFENEFTDISPLAELKNLKEVNLCGCRVEDYTPLTTLEHLERVWYTVGLSTDENRQYLKTHLPEGCVSRCVGMHNFHPCRGWRPIDYRTWGFKYEHELNQGMIERMEEVKVNLSHANIDPDAYSDDYYDTASASDAPAGEETETPSDDS